MTTPSVDISARPIAAGINGGKVRIVLALMPVQGDAVALNEWPEAVEQKLAKEGGWNLYVVAATSGAGDQRPTPPAHLEGLDPVSLDGATIHTYGNKLAAQGKGRLGAHANDLWNWVMGAGATGERNSFVWDGILSSIKAASVAKPPTINVAAVRRADAALYYSVARARALFWRDKTAAPTASGLKPFDPNASKGTTKAYAAKAIAATREDNPEIAAMLKADIARGQTQSALRAQYLDKSTKASELIALLSKEAGVGPAVSMPEAVIKAALDGDHDDALAMELRALHVASTLDDVDKQGEGTPRADGATLRNFQCDKEGAAQLLEALQSAPQLLFALRSNPTLGRLFRFVIDVELPVEAFITAAGITPNKTTTERFVFLAASFGGPPVWVVSKLTFAESKLTQAWPALRAEMDIDAVEKSSLPGTTFSDARRLAVTQSNGLVCLGQGLDDNAPWSRHARYDLATIDPVFATESDVRRSALRQSIVDNAARSGQDVDPLKLAAVPDPSVISRGLVVLDRWRQSAIVSEITTAAAFCAACGASDTVVVDAEDLATGLSIHVAAPSGGALVWRSQMHRRIAYADPRKTNGVDIEELLHALGLESGSVWRIQSDAASVTVPSRNRETADAPIVHVEENICSMEGDPLALSCKTETGIAIAPGVDLAINRVYSLVTSGHDRPPPLRFGWSYKVGAGPIWMGGVSVPTETAARLFDRDPSLTLPSIPPSLAEQSPKLRLMAARRFLRQEAIKPPVVLLPVYLATRRDERVRQTGPVVILREDIDQDRSSWRLVVPPQVSLDDAWRHGVFDADPEPSKGAESAHPRDGLLNVDWDEPWGGFPVYGRLKHESGPAAAGLNRLVSNPTKQPTKKGTLPPPPAEPGQPVFEARRSIQSRALPYYPDPAAYDLVIALRPVAAREQGEDDKVRSRASKPYFDGKPQVVPLRAASADFREILPVAIEFCRLDSHRTNAPTQEDLFAHLDGGNRYGVRYADGKSDRLDSQGRPGDAKILAVQVRLHKGEHVAADCWFAPTEAKLRGWFDLPETLAMLGDADIESPDNIALGIIEENLGLPGGTLVKIADDLTTKKRMWLASAGLPVREHVVATLARYLSGELRRKPIPQLSAVVTIEAAHAVWQPQQPKFLKQAAIDDGTVTPSPQAKTVAAQPVSLTRYDTGQNGAADARLSLLQGFQTNKRWTTDIPVGATGVLLAGDLLVDRDASGVLEIIAQCASPHSNKMDDPARMRTDQQRLEGVFPKTKRAETGAPAPKERQETSKELFGFSVAADGQVKLSRAGVTLLRLDGFEGRTEQPVEEGLDTMALVDEQVRALVRSPTPDATIPTANAPRVTAFDPFKDQLARRLTLKLHASTRYIPLLETIVAAPGVLVPPPVPDSDLPTSDTSDADLELWLPATQRPSAPVVDSTLPLPIRSRSDKPDEEGITGWTRTCAVRISLERPWFSSGEGERLGVVVWPPRTGQVAEDNLRLGLVERPAPLDGTKPGPDDQLYMAMVDFTDDDLGPGGKFITRWGADPIRVATGPTGPFLPASALIDFEKGLQATIFDQTLTAADRAALFKSKLSELAAPKDGRIGYVGSVPMPIFPQGADDRGAKPAQTILVDLVTYEPRFDPDSEKWFVEVAIDPGTPQALVEPFVRFGLVRFQEHALTKPDLRTSAPTIAWAQILPPRDAIVWNLSPEREDSLIAVQVAGPIAARRGEKGELREARLRVALQSEIVLEGGAVVTSIIRQHKEDGNGPASEADGWVTVAHGAPEKPTLATGGAWVRRLKDDAAAKEHDSSRRLFVLVEEVEDYAPTDDEAVRDTDETSRVLAGRAKPGECVSGFRFAAKIAVPLKTVKPHTSEGSLPVGPGKPILKRRY